MTDREIMQQALDALNSPNFGVHSRAISALQERLAHCDRCGKKLGGEGDIHTCTPDPIGDAQDRLIAEMAAQPEQEPVANHRDLHSHMMVVAHRAVDEASNNGRESISQKEVVRAICKAIQSNKNLLAKLTLPTAQRPWVGLTDEDKHLIELSAGITEDDDGYIVSQMFKLTEAKLKERNT
jgi:hypothetical protein